MAHRPIFGSPVSPRESLQAVGDQLADWFEPHRAGESSLRLRAVSEDLPAVTLSYQRERRLFSRTLQLVVEAPQRGTGPSKDAAFGMRARRLRKRWKLEWSAPPPSGEEGILDQFVHAGLSEGAHTMTNVRELGVSWSLARQEWTLRLVTLAGALIGTSPGAWITVPLEPEDLRGLLGILRGFKKAASA
jgi:hypothetical protein